MSHKNIILGSLSQPPFVGISEQIAIHARFRSAETALIEGSRSVDWASYNTTGDRIASALQQQRVKKGDRIALLVGNCIWAHELLLGIWRVGAIAVPLSPMLNADALNMMLKDCDCQLLFSSAGYTDLAKSSLTQLNTTLISEGESFDQLLASSPINRSVVDVNLDFNDLAVIIYSSGTTGAPKGIAHSHGSRLNYGDMLAAELSVKSTSLILSSIPIHSNGAWLMWLPAKLMGAPTLILPQFSPDAFIKLVRKHRPTHGFIVPAICVGLLDHPDIETAGLDSFEVALSAGAPMPKQVKEAMRRLTSDSLYEIWGLSEGVHTMIAPTAMNTRPTSVGRPTLGCNIRLINDRDQDVTFTGVGEIVGYSNAMMSGYWQRPEANKALIWKDEHANVYMRTGDIGEFDSDGFLTLRGRIKDMIISGGVNIYPIDIETELRKHADLRDVCVVGVEHRKWGETPIAFVIVKPGQSLSADNLKEWANQRLAKHQRLHDVIVSHIEFPRNLLGKVLKNKLLNEYTSGR